MDLDGRTLRVLAPEHQLLVACLHLSRHAFCAGLRWLADLKLLLPAPLEVRGRFVEEARAWPQRAVYCPLWLLALQGVPGSEAFPEGLEAGPAERRVLQHLLPPLLLEEPWLGLPAWRGAKALHAWLFSDRSLLSLLPEVWGEGFLRRWQAREGNDGVKAPPTGRNLSRLGSNPPVGAEGVQVSPPVSSARPPPPPPRASRRAGGKTGSGRRDGSCPSGPARNRTTGT